MIATWMLYTIGVSGLLAAGAMALDGAMRHLGKPARWIWAVALALSMAVPAASALAPPHGHGLPHPTGPKRPLAAGSHVMVTRPVELRTAERMPRIDLAPWNRPLALGWLASSTAVLAALVGMAGVLAFRRRRWVDRVVDGVCVLVSADTGPAVVGLVRGRIVLPAWAVDADAEARALVLDHEREHLRAGDPRLLACGLAIAALMPWNPAVWWQLRRLRLAVEVDCDARVLRRRGADVRAYGSVLLEVGRRAGRTRLPAAAFSEPVSSLERRIRVMTAPRARRPLLRAAAFGVVAAALVAAACEAPHPLQPALDGTRRVYAAPGSEGMLPHSPVGLRAAVARYFPGVARHGLPADQALVFVLSPTGEFLRHEVVRTGAPDPAHPLGERGLSDVVRTISPDAVRSVDVMLQPAGVLGPTPTRVVWVAIKGPGDPTNELSISGPEATSRPGDRTFPKSFRVTTYGGADGARYVAATGADVDNPGATVAAAAVHAAMLRYYTPQMAAAGLTGEARVEYTVDARGRLTHTDVYAKPEALQPVARAVIESLSFPGSAKPSTAMLMMRFEPGLLNGH